MSEIKKVIKVEVENQKANKALEETKNKTTEVSQEAKKTKANFSGVFGTIDSLSGGAISSIKSTLGAVKGLSLGFRGLAGAIAATGIGALVILLVSAFEWFKNTEAGAKALDTTLNAVGAVVGQLGAAFGRLLQGDFSGFIDEIGGIGEAVRDSVDATNDLYDAEAALFELRRDNIVSTAEDAARREQIQKIVEDTTLSEEDRVAAVESLRQINAEIVREKLNELSLQEQITKAELANENNAEKQRELELEIQQILAERITLQNEANLINRQAEREKRNIEKAREERETAAAEERKKETEEQAKLEKQLLNETEKARIANLESEKERIQAEFDLNIAGIREKYGKGTELEEELTKAKNTRLKVIEDQRIQDEKDRQATIDEILEGDRELDPFEKLAKEREAALIELENLNATETEKLALKNSFLGKEDKLREKFAKDEEDRQKAVRDLEIDLATQAVGAIAGILGEGNEIGQGLAAASALMNTYQGITAALKDPTIPSTVARIAQASLVGIQGFTAVKNILSTDPSGSNVGSQSGSGGGGSTSTNISGGARFDLTAPTPLDDIDETPTQVYVTSDEVSTQQSLDRNRQRNSRFI